MNNDTRGKAVKVAFREGRNGAVVLNFNLFLSALDVWTAAVVSNSGGGALLLTRDSSCSNPRIPNAGVAFRSFGYESDAGFRELDRTSEGYFEIVEMASIVPNSPLDVDIRPNASGVRSCALLTDASIATRQSELQAPRGKLSGNGTLALNSMSTGYAALALQGLDLPTLITPSANEKPAGFTSARSKTAIITEATPTRTYTIFAEFNRSIDAVSAVLTQTALTGEYSAEPGFTTDLVMTFPTKFFYTNSPDAGSVSNPFLSRWNGTNASACETLADIKFVNREGKVNPRPARFPRERNGNVCFAITVDSFLGNRSSPLASELRVNSSLDLDSSSGFTFGTPLGFAFDETDEYVSGSVAFEFHATTPTGSSNPNLQSNANSRVIVTESGAATREITGPVKFYGLPVVGFNIASAQFADSKNNFNSSYLLTGSRILPE